MTKQGAPNTVNPLTGDVFDLDALLAKRSLQPAAVKLGGKTYKIRTDLTSIETARFVALMRESKDLEAFTLLLGDKDSIGFNEYVDKLPRMHQALVSARVMHASKALAQYAKSEDEIYAEYKYDVDGVEPAEQGESSAS